MATWSLISFQDSATPAMEQLVLFHDFTMAILSLIITMVGLIMTLMCYSKLTDMHLIQEQTIEVVWTVMPVFILLSIALPSLKALYFLEEARHPAITLKAVGHQWYWTYEYSDFSDIEFDSYMMPLEDSKETARLLQVDNSTPLPTNTPIRVITTSTDVIHAWTVPALGVKADAIPGRLNQMSFSSPLTGIFYGQCSEICGANHSFMPVKLEMIPTKEFSDWVLK